MITKIDSIDNIINEAVELIRKGDIVAFPTETVYGLGADATNINAVKKIFEAKGRPQDNPLIVHLSNIDSVSMVAKNIPAMFYTIADRFMPGPITVILEKADIIPFEVTAGLETVGIRIPSCIIARQFIEATGCYIAAPSANKSKHISPTLAKHVYDDLNGEISLIIDGGATEVGIESTIIDLTTSIPTILRPGSITVEMLTELLGNVSYNNSQTIKIAKAPGMKYKHYAPTVPAELVETAEEAYLEYDNFKGKGVIIASNNDLVNIGNRNYIDLGYSNDDYAKNIYNALHLAEKNYSQIWIVSLENRGVGYSVMNRIKKATKRDD